MVVSIEELNGVTVHPDAVSRGSIRLCLVDLSLSIGRTPIVADGLPAKSICCAVDSLAGSTDRDGWIAESRRKENCSQMVLIWYLGDNECTD
jgi:hypothetical protein